MGDSCWVEINVRPEHVREVEEAFGGPAPEKDTNKDGSIHLFIDEVKYVEDALVNLQRKKIPYHGCHGEGFGYGPRCFWSDGKKEDDWERGWEEGFVVIPDSQGAISREQCRRLKGYIFGERRTKNIVKVKDAKKN